MDHQDHTTKLMYLQVLLEDSGLENISKLISLIVDSNYLLTLLLFPDMTMMVDRGRNDDDDQIVQIMCIGLMLLSRR